ELARERSIVEVGRALPSLAGCAEVDERILRDRAEVVVRAVYKYRRDAGLSEWAQRVQQWAAGETMPHEVAGEHDEVRSKLDEPTHPVDLAVLPRRKVQVAQLQHAQGSCPV